MVETRQCRPLGHNPRSLSRTKKDGTRERCLEKDKGTPLPGHQRFVGIQILESPDEALPTPPEKKGELRLYSFQIRHPSFSKEFNMT